MESNLKKKFGMDANLEKNGIWVDVDTDVSFLIRRFGGDNHIKLKEAHAKYMKPHARLIELGSIPRKTMLEIEAKVFIDACLVDWKGVEFGGEVKPFSKELALELFIELPELLATLVACSQDKDNYRLDLGNF